MNRLTRSPILNRLCSAQLFAAINRQYTVIIDPPDDATITIPIYTKTGETLEKRKARLIYQSRKRGMLENDLLLSTFANRYLKDMDMKQVEEYDKLINQPSNDWDIYYWGVGLKPVPEEFDNEMMKLFQEHVQNLKKEQRLRMPDLD